MDAVDQLQDLAATAALSTAAQAPGAFLSSSVSMAAPATVALAHDLDEQDEKEEEDEGEDDDDGEGDDANAGDLVTDARRNWGHDVTLALVRIWKRVCETHPHAGRVARMELVFDEFHETVDQSNRSRKAVEDKLYSVKQMYQFIVKTSGSFHKSHGAGSASAIKQDADGRPVPTWFELTKDERRVVRSLHRVRIPNISLEVFQVLDSVLNPIAHALAGPEGVAATALAPTASLPARPVEAVPISTATMSYSSEEATTARRDSADIVDNKRNWSHDVTLQLARAWHTAVRGQRDLRGAMLSQRVHNEFLRVVGSCSRSRKAIEDKMHSMKEMYRFIRLYNAGCVNGSGKTLWFDLSKPERRHIRNAHKIRVPNLSAEVYAELDAFMSHSVDVVENIPIGISNLIAAQQNLSMATPAAVPSPAGFATSASGAGDQAPVSAANPLGAALTVTYEVMRRLAEEENQLVPASLSPPSGAPHGSAQPSSARPPTEESSTGGVCRGEPPAKRQRTAAAVVVEELGTQELRLQELLALQRQAIAERRQQHAEQMALLMEISSMLRQQQQ